MNRSCCLFRFESCCVAGTCATSNSRDLVLRFFISKFQPVTFSCRLLRLGAAYAGLQPCLFFRRHPTNDTSFRVPPLPPPDVLAPRFHGSPAKPADKLPLIHSKLDHGVETFVDNLGCISTFHAHASPTALVNSIVRLQATFIRWSFSNRHGAHINQTTRQGGSFELSSD